MSTFFWRLCATATVTAATAVLISDFAIDLEAKAGPVRPGRKRSAVAEASAPPAVADPEAGDTTRRTRRSVNH